MAHSAWEKDAAPMISRREKFLRRLSQLTYEGGARPQFHYISMDEFPNDKPATTYIARYGDRFWKIGLKSREAALLAYLHGRITREYK